MGKKKGKRGQPRGKSSRRGGAVDLSRLVGLIELDAGGWEALAGAGDAEDLGTSYEAFRAQLERAEAQLRAEGLAPVRVEVEVEALRRWCEILEIPCDGAARARFVAQELHRMVEAGDEAVAEALQR